MRKLCGILIILILVMPVTGCFTMNTSGIESQDLSALQPPRQFPKVYLGVPGTYKRAGIEHPWRMTEHMGLVLENSGLFVEAVVDGKRLGPGGVQGLYIDTDIENRDGRAGGKSFALGMLSVFTLGTVPFPLFYQYDFVGKVYADGKLLKTYRYPIKHVLYVWMPPLMVMPSAFIFGKTEATAEKILIARYTTSLLTDMQRDGIVFPR